MAAAFMASHMSRQIGPGVGVGGVGRVKPLRWERWEAELHKSIWASDSCAPGGRDAGRAARQQQVGFGAHSDVGEMSSTAAPTFNPLSDTAQPRGPGAKSCQAPGDPRRPVLNITSINVVVG